ncbi:zinc finger protein SHOOT GRAVITROPISM 5-like [Dioscorea cayenensis subsp. rotundata]|uniref:Zinc finger protein SHOOT GRAVITROPISM 5-like n=1 Tax=Dioscorea cayennensis subsp. rotundata TaxID=55577 RepID=A0AB40CWA5_DIOCR|nr:zinc finger protein SHOOT GRAVITROPISM 5-like [Dioscorea cayenensis subsp. rotundata]
MFGGGSSPETPVETTPPASQTPDNSASTNKRKRRPAGTPDPDAEVVSLSPRTLLESDRYVCEICGQGFQRDQNLQMHRRRHKVPWKLLKREAGAGEARKRVFVCPEPTCLHHDPGHALGDLVGIKKHFRRKHSAHKQWVCNRCGKGYAVQSDYKAHLKTCGTRGHSCDCGRVFSRVESFIEHQDTCNASRTRPELQVTPVAAAGAAACLSRTASSPSPSSDTNFSASTWPGLRMPKSAMYLNPDNTIHSHNLELQLMPSSTPRITSFTSPAISPASDEAHVTKLQLSMTNSGEEPTSSAVMRIKEETREQLKLAMAEKAMAEEARQQAKRQMELAEEEFTNAKHVRQQAQVELNKAYMLRDQATRKVNSILLQITCQACKLDFQTTPVNADEVSLAASHVSSVVTQDDRRV